MATTIHTRDLYKRERIWAKVKKQLITEGKIATNR